MNMFIKDMMPFKFSHIKMSFLISFLVISVLLSISVKASAATDDEIKAFLIQQSTASYKGNCPCPYNYAKNGSICGKRSAYSRPGGAAPLCYSSDITDQMVNSIRELIKKRSFEKNISDTQIIQNKEA